MKEFIKALFFFSLLICFNNEAFSQEKGFYVGLGVQGVGWSLPEYDFDKDAGSGIAIRGGYHINKNFGVFMGIDASEVEPYEGENYSLGHFEIGAEGKIVLSNSKFKPYGRLSLVGLAVLQEDPMGDVEISGGGVGIGIGTYINLTEKLAFDIGFFNNSVTIEEISVGNTTLEVEEDANSSRFLIGVIYNF